MLRFLCVFAALAFLPLAGLAENLTGRIVGVADGDTVTILTADKQQHRIRIAGIDAPEKAQPFGNRSKQNMERMATAKRRSPTTLHATRRST